MYTVLVISLLLFATALLPDLFPAAGFDWDALNGFGFSGLAVLVALAWDSETPPRSVRLRLHQNLAVAAAILISAHALGFLWHDPLLLEHLSPTAPVHMLMAVVGYLALLALVTTSFPAVRRRIYPRFQHFRRWHLGLSLTTLTAALWHVIETGSVYSGALRSTALLLLAGLIPALAVIRRRKGLHDRLSPPPLDIASSDRQAVVLFFSGLLFAGGYAALKNL